jgi:RHS repeat-associated protein
LITSYSNAQQTRRGTVLSQTRTPGAGAQTSYFGLDSHGSVTFLTDANGAVTDSYDYDAWGNVVGRSGSTPNSRLYVGEEFDSTLGFINLRARYYDPGRGRFLSMDPADRPFRAGAFASSYVYGANDPLRFIDPTGRTEFIEGRAVEEWQKKTTTWVYKFVHKGLCYIGITVDIDARQRKHRRRWGKEAKTIAERLDASQIYLEKLFPVDGDVARAAEQAVINLLLGAGGVPDGLQKLVLNKVNSVAMLALEWDAAVAEGALYGGIGPNQLKEVTKKIQECIKKR